MEYLFAASDVIRAKVMDAPRLYLALDYDGTLTPTVNDQRLALLPSRTKKSLQSLVSNTHCLVAVVSGRRVTDITRLVGIDRAYYIGNHGLEIRGPGFKFVHTAASRLSRCLPKLRLRLNQQLVGTGALVENKGLTISVHYRNAQPKLTSTILSKVRLVLEDYDMFEASYGKKVIDVRPRLTWNKGTAVQLLMQHEGLYPIIYVGDDYTDEDAFVELNDAIKILVSRHPETSNATYYLKSPLDVARFLRLINLWLQEMDSEL